MTTALLAAKALLVLSSALASGQIGHPDAHAFWSSTNRPAPVPVAPHLTRHADDGALDGYLVKSPV